MKDIILSTLLIFLNFQANTQTSTSLGDSLQIVAFLKKSEAMSAAGKQDSAMNLGQQALDFSKQTLGEAHIMTINALQVIGGNYFASRKFEQGKAPFHEALRIFPKIKNPPPNELGDTYLDLGKCYIDLRQFDSGCTFIHLAIENLAPINRRAERQLCNAWGLAGTCAADYEHDLEKATADFEKSKFYAERTGDSLFIAATHFRFGGLLLNQGDLRAAITELDAAQKLLDETKIPRPFLGLKGRCMANIGAAYSNMGQPIKAIAYTQQALDLFEKLAGANSWECAIQHENLSNHLNNSLQNTEKQLFHARRAVEIYKKLPVRSPDDLPSSLSVLAQALLNQQNFAEVEQVLQEVLSLCNDQQNDLKIPALNLLGKAKIDQNQWAEALPFYKTALSLLDSARYPPTWPDRCRTHERLGALYTQQGNFAEAERHFDAEIAATGWQGTSLGAATYPTYVLVAIRFKSNCLLQKFKKTGDPKDLQNSSEQLDLYEKLLQDFQKSGKFEPHHATEIHHAAGLAITQKRLENQATAIRQAFDWSEKSRAVSLLANVRQSDALQFSGIPDSLLLRERKLDSEIARFQQFQQEVQAQQGSMQTPFDTKVANLLDERERLQQIFEQRFPDYFKLKYDLSTTSIADVQRDLLATDQALLEYFVGDSSIFIFKIEKEKFEVQEVKKDFPLEKWITELRDATTNFFIDPKFENQYDSLAQIFIERSHQLYQKLVAPVGQNLPPRLIIVPDGVLGYLPFEPLLTAPSSAPPNRWQQHNYLMLKHSVQYCPSATMLREMSFRKTKTEPTVSFCGFAPHFTGDTTTLAAVFPDEKTTRKDLAPLPFSGEEVARLSKLMKGKYLAGADASKSQFLAAAPTAKILHLATHGQANDRTGDYCFLAFAPNPTSPEQAVLFAREIYNLNLNADLVALSACETGIGQLQNGEGIISLARAFAYAGAKSIVTSFWSVSDAKTKDLMLDFYKNLRRGEPKDLALRQAKLDFLRKNRGQAAHPFFWAGFVGMGSF